MREEFIKKLVELREKDDSIILLVGDVGFNFIEKFRDRFPQSFLNLGICEQSMLGVAAGLAKQGLKPYVYTMRNFILLRPLEQLRNDICYPNENVKLFGVRGSEAYKFLGFSHNMTDEEEMDIVKNLPNLSAHFTKDPEVLSLTMDQEHQKTSPAYFSI